MKNHSKDKEIQELIRYYQETGNDNFLRRAQKIGRTNSKRAASNDRRIKK